MKKILLIGAGRSSTTLIKYLLEKSREYGWELTVADRDEKQALEKAPMASRQISLDIFNEQQLDVEVMEADIVVSMLPARFHPLGSP